MKKIQWVFFMMILSGILLCGCHRSNKNNESSDTLAKEETSFAKDTSSFAKKEKKHIRRDESGLYTEHTLDMLEVETETFLQEFFGKMYQFDKDTTEETFVKELRPYFSDEKGLMDYYKITKKEGFESKYLGSFYPATFVVSDSDITTIVLNVIPDVHFKAETWEEDDYSILLHIELQEIKGKLCISDFTPKSIFAYQTAELEENGFDDYVDIKGDILGNFETESKIEDGTDSGPLEGNYGDETFITSESTEDTTED